MSDYLARTAYADADIEARETADPEPEWLPDRDELGCPPGFCQCACYCARRAGMARQ